MSLASCVQKLHSTFVHFIGLIWHLPWHRVQLVCGAAAAVRTRDRTGVLTVPAGDMPWQDCWLVLELCWLMASTTIRLGGDKICKGSKCLICCCYAKAELCQLQDSFFVFFNC